MDGQGQVSFGLPRPGRALWALLIVVTALGIFQALLSTWGGTKVIFDWLVCDSRAIDHLQVWRLLTSGVLTSPYQISHLIYTLLGLYFLGTDLERRWGPGRFLRFLALGVIAGNVVALAVGRFAGSALPERFNQLELYGAMAAITAIAIAWSRENADVTVRLFFFIPIRGRILFWVTIGFCVLDLIYPMVIPEGVVAPFGGVAVGILLGGSPSIARTLYLRAKLALLRRRGGSLRSDDLLAPPEGGTTTPRRSREGAPPLRIVQGGLEDVLRKRKPPKDKRYLN